MKLNFDFDLPNNARIIIKDYSTLLVVSLCVPKSLYGIKYTSVDRIVQKTTSRYVIRKTLVLTHINREIVTKAYYRAVKDLQIEARMMKKELLNYEIDAIQLNLAL